MLRSSRILNPTVRCSRITLLPEARYVHGNITNYGVRVQHLVNTSRTFTGAHSSIQRFKCPQSCRSSFTILSANHLKTLRNHVRNHSSKGTKNGGNTNRRSKLRNNFWYYLAKMLKIIRIPALVTSVYVLGYQQGVVDFGRDPRKKTEELLRTVIMGVGCDDPDNVYSVSEGAHLKSFLKTSSVKHALLKSLGKNGYETGADREMQLRNVAIIAERIVQAAKLYVDEKLSEQRREYDSKHTSADGSDDGSDDVDDEVTKWTEAKERIGDEFTTWNFVLIDVPVPNAFVSETLPNTIFVTTALLEKFVSNDDELGLVLGHEVSHLILGHLSQRNSMSVNMSIIEILLLTMDPTEGLISVFVVGAIASLKEMIEAGFSRETEYEADELGIVIAARACFDTKIGPRVFKKMHEELINDNQVENSQVLTLKSNLVEENGTDESKDEDPDSQVTMDESGKWSNILATHPPTLERYSNLMKLGSEENPDKYLDSHCSHLKKSFFLSSLLSRKYAINGTK